MAERPSMPPPRYAPPPPKPGAAPPMTRELSPPPAMPPPPPPPSMQKANNTPMINNYNVNNNSRSPRNVDESPRRRRVNGTPNSRNRNRNDDKYRDDVSEASSNNDRKRDNNVIVRRKKKLNKFSAKPTPYPGVIKKETSFTNLMEQIKLPADNPPSVISQIPTKPQTPAPLFSPNTVRSKSPGGKKKVRIPQAPPRVSVDIISKVAGARGGAAISYNNIKPNSDGLLPPEIPSPRQAMDRERSLTIQNKVAKQFGKKPAGSRSKDESDDGSTQNGMNNGLKTVNRVRRRVRKGPTSKLTNQKPNKPGSATTAAPPGMGYRFYSQ